VAKNTKFYYKETELEIVSEYNYVGILFSSSGLFRKELIQAKSKARSAAARVRELLRKGKQSNWESTTKLFDAIVRSVLLYRADVWSLRYTKEIEAIETVSSDNSLVSVTTPQIG